MNANASVSPRAREMLRDAIVWDNHGCMPMRPEPTFLPQLQRYKVSGCSTVSINVGYGPMDWDLHISLLNFIRQWLLERPSEYVLIQSADDVALAKQTDRLGIFFDVEGMVPVQDDPSRVRRLYDLGVKWMLIAYNKNNAAGGGCLEEDRGLTAIGRRIIDEMDAAGMLVCLSHSGARTARDALEHTRNPPIFSHSNPIGLAAHPRNVSDELIKACAAKGGVIGLNGVGPFLGASDDLISALVRHIQYVIDLVGVEHVGLGLDYLFDRNELDDPAMHSPGINSSLAMIQPEDIPEIVEHLCGLGLNDTAIRGILGENWLRIARQVWK